MNKKTDYLKIGQVGTFEIKLPILTLGSGKPKIGIVSGLHGKEISGVLVISKLIETLKIQKGQLSILPISNPFGILFGTRNEPLEGKDLNRQFPGGQKDFAALLAKAIFDFFKNFDLVIDLHSFSRETPILAVWPKVNKKVDDLTLSLINKFGPEVIWQIEKSDSEFQGALDSSLVELGIPAFAVEMIKSEKITQEQIAKICKGLTNILISLKMCKGQLKSSKKAPVLKIKTIFCEQNGIFIPSTKPLSKIVKNQEIGTITDISTFEKKPFLSPSEGVLVTILENGFVRKGTKIASIGQQV